MLGKVREGPEYEAALELEVWKRAQQARFRAELRAKEGERMRVLEEEWRRRERQRSAELAAARERTGALEARLRGMVAALEERERRLVAAEEAFALRREGAERENALRAGEMEAVVRRVKAECSVAVQSERARAAESGRQAAQLEQRLAAANTRYDQLERAFYAYKEQHRATPEAALAAEVAALQRQLAEAERRAEAAVHAKQQYREQVLKLARELAKAQKLRAHADSSGGAHSQAAEMAGKLAEEEARRAREDRMELLEVRSRLAALQMHANAQQQQQQFQQQQQQFQQQQQQQHQQQQQQHQQQQTHDVGAAVAAAAAAAAAAAVASSMAKQQQQQQHSHFSPSKQRARRKAGGYTSLRPSTAPQSNLQESEADSKEEKRVRSSKAGRREGTREIKRMPLHRHSRSDIDVDFAALVDSDDSLWDSDVFKEDAEQTGAGREHEHEHEHETGGLAAEIDRLLRERASLITTGVYAPSDPVICKLDERVHELSRKIAE